MDIGIIILVSDSIGFVCVGDSVDEARPAVAFRLEDEVAYLKTFKRCHEIPQSKAIIRTRCVIRIMCNTRSNS